MSVTKIATIPKMAAHVCRVLLLDCVWLDIVRLMGAACSAERKDGIGQTCGGDLRTREVTERNQE